MRIIFLIDSLKPLTQWSLFEIRLYCFPKQVYDNHVTIFSARVKSKQTTLYFVMRNMSIKDEIPTFRGNKQRSVYTKLDFRTFSLKYIIQDIIKRQYIMVLLNNLDHWNKVLFFSIVILFIFMTFFRLETISEILTEGLMNMH